MGNNVSEYAQYQRDALEHEKAWNRYVLEFRRATDREDHAKGKQIRAGERAN